MFLNSTVKVGEAFGAEVGEYAIILPNNLAVSRADIEEEGLKITPAENGGAIEVSSEIYKLAENINKTYIQLEKLTKENKGATIITTPDAYEEGAEEAGI
jgi:hypothetical protein